MKAQRPTRAAMVALLLAGVACARNKTNDEVGAARDSTMAAPADSTTNQTESGVTDSAGKSTLGKKVGQTRPDQGQPVTSKGDTINPGVDSAAGSQGQVSAPQDSSSMRMTSDSTANAADTTASQSDPTPGQADTTVNQTESGVTDSAGQSTLGKGVEQTRPDQGQPVTSKGDTLNPGVDSASVDSTSTQR